MAYLIPLKDLATNLTSGRMFGDFDRDLKSFLFYSGANREIIVDAIRREFTKPETILEMEKRVVTINIYRKVIDKLAQVYTRAPKRLAANQDVDDQELLEQYEWGLALNQRMKEMNRGFKRDKRALIEFYTSNGMPHARVLPAHTYRVFSATPENPAADDVIVQIMGKGIFRYWDDTQMVDFDRFGEIVDGSRVSLSGATGMGKKPFVYLNECTYATHPIQSDDLLNMSITIPIILTDLLFGLKFQCWSVIYTIGAKGQWNYNPNTIIELDRDDDGKDPIIETIKPNMDSDKMLSSVVFMLNMLLSTNNLKAGDVQMDSASVASGVSKMIDSAETLESREDQEEYFQQVEWKMWNLLSDYLIPYWRLNKELTGIWDKEFSDDFEVSTTFPEPAVMMSEQEKVATAKAKLDARLTTRKREIQKLNSEMGDEEVEKLLLDIAEEEQMSRVAGSGVPFAEDQDGVEPNL